jgi:hypothetical protein
MDLRGVPDIFPAPPRASGEGGTARLRGGRGAGLDEFSCGEK